jgi:hypothetical protein
MPQHLATTTQQRYPGRASWRTAIQAALGVLLTAGVVVPIVVTILNEQLGKWLPDAWEAWLVGAAAFVAALSAGVARVMAIPAVDAWLARVGLSSAPPKPPIHVLPVDPPA